MRSISRFVRSAPSATIRQSTVARTASTPIERIVTSVRVWVTLLRYSSWSSSIMIDAWSGDAWAAGAQRHASRTVSAESLRRLIGAEP